MKNTQRVAEVVLAAVLVCTGPTTLAAGPAPTPAPAPAAAAEPAPPAPKAADADVAKQLEDARARLQAAAADVAALSAQLGPRGDFTTFTLTRTPAMLLGVQVDNATNGGAHVIAVSPGGGSAAAGVKPDDVIVGINGRDLRGSANPAAELVEHMRDVKPTDTLKLQILRDGRTLETEVRPREAPAQQSFAYAMPAPVGVPLPPPPPGAPMTRVQRIEMAPAEGGAIALGGGPGPGRMLVQGVTMPAMPVTAPLPGGNVMFDTRIGGFTGLELANLSPRLGQYFGAKQGVLVVRAGASRFRLEDGDVIVAIDGREPASAAHATRILGSYQRGEKITIKALRDRKSVTLDTTASD